MIHLILAGGMNTRFKNSDFTTKSLLPIDGKTLIQHLICYNKILPFTKTVIVIKKENTEIQEFLKEYTKMNQVEIFHQKSGTTLIDGLISAKNLDEDVFLSLSDEFVLNPNLINISKLSTKRNIVLAYEDTEDLDSVRETFSFKTHKDSKRLSHFIEKPTSPKIKRRGTGHILFSKEAFKRIKSYNFDEIKNIDHLLNQFVKEEFDIIGTPIGDMYFNINTNEQYLELQKKLCKTVKDQSTI